MGPYDEWPRIPAASLYCALGTTVPRWQDAQNLFG